MMVVDDIYRVLQVDPEAEFDVIRAAYRVLAAKNHPDVGGSPARMTAINCAWTVASNPERRAAYDRERRLRETGDRWNVARARQASTLRNRSSILEFGRYAGWSLAEVAVIDRDFLEWLVRTPNGRRYQAEIDELLPVTTSPSPAPPAARKRRIRW
jgi:curved DNA-binding protein CbpA